MYITKGCTHAIRAAIYLSLNKNRHRYVAIKTIGDDLGISHHFLTKIVQILAKNGIMHLYRGPNGGASIARSPNEIKLMDIVKIVDGENVLSDCILGLSNCDELNPCAMHDYWLQARDNFLNYLANTTVDELAQKHDVKIVRLSD